MKWLHMTELTKQCQAEPSVVSINCVFVDLYQLVRLTVSAISEWGTKTAECNYSICMEVAETPCLIFPYKLENLAPGTLTVKE